MRGKEKGWESAIGAAAAITTVVVEGGRPAIRAHWRCSGSGSPRRRPRLTASLTIAASCLTSDPGLAQRVALLRLYLARADYTAGPLFRASINGSGGPLSYDAAHHRWEGYCIAAGVGLPPAASRPRYLPCPGSLRHDDFQG